MATSGTYYLDGPTLETATAVFTDITLFTKAADGWYSIGGIVREQVGGVLQATVICNSCQLACGDTLVMDTDRGYYTIQVDLGAATGAIEIELDVNSIPDGIKVEYDGSTYNSVYSANFGYLTSTGTEPIYLGISAFDCSISGATFSGLTDYQFNGTGFNATGNLQSVTVDPASVQLQASGLGTCRMIIPKPNATPSTATITLISPCSTADITITPECASGTALSSFQTTLNTSTPTNSSGLCTVVSATTFYHLPINGTPGNPAVGDIMFQDVNGATPANDGYYAVVGYPSATGVIEVAVGGEIIAIAACVP